MRRILRWLLIGLGGLLGIILLLGAAGYLWLASDGGRAWLAHAVEAAVSTPDRRIALTGLAGAPPFHLRLQRIELADRTGPWLALDDVVLDLDGWALLGGTARIERLTAQAITVTRAPEAGPRPATPAASGVGLPSLPVAVELDALAFPRVTLAPALAGTAIAFSVDGSARLHAGAGRLRLRI